MQRYNLDSNDQRAKVSRLIPALAIEMDLQLNVENK